MTTTALAPITNLDDVLATIADELSPATRKAYAQAMKQVLSHYDKCGWELYPSADEGFNGSAYLGQVLSYLQTLKAEGKTVSTINKTLAALKHDAGSHAHASGLLVSKPVVSFMNGLRRGAVGTRVRKASAFTLAELKMVHASLKKQNTVRAARDRALISLGVATALRASSLSELTLSDLANSITMNGFLVSVRFSKTDQLGEGHTIPVKAATDPLLDPVRAVGEYLAILAHFGFTAASTPDFPLFPTLRGNKVQEGKIQHPAVTITELVRNAAVSSGVAASQEDSARFSSHSLRSSFITLSSQAGVSERLIAAVSGHQSMTILRSYDRTSVEKLAQIDYLS